MADPDWKHFNIGCKWRYKQMRYSKHRDVLHHHHPCHPCHPYHPHHLRDPLLAADRHCKSIDNESSEFDDNELDIDIDDQNSADKKYLCDYVGCHKMYKSWFQLQRHRSQHYKVQNKPYLCDWNGCHNQFKKLKNLIIHRRLHTGERPFKCDIENCNKSFRAAHSLSSHRRTHNDVYDKVSTRFEKKTKS